MVSRYVPDDMKTDGNFMLVFCESIEDLAAPTLAELNAGVAVECASRGFDQSTNVSTNTDQYLCDTEAREEVGSRTRQIAPFEIDAEDITTDDDFTDLVTEDAVVYLWVRPGVKHTEDIAAAQRGWGYKVRVSSVDPKAVTAGATGSGQKFGYRVAVTVLERELKSEVATTGGA